MTLPGAETEIPTGLGPRMAAGFASDFVPAWIGRVLAPGSDRAPVAESLAGNDTAITSLAQFRTVFTLAHLHLATGRADLLEAARRVHRFAAEHLAGPRGGYRASVSPNGADPDEATSRLCRSYDQSFALLALATLHKADPASVSRQEIEALWRFVEDVLIDPATGALWEDDRGPAGSSVRAQNPQMHMLEALLQAFETTADPIWMDRARPFVSIAARHLVDAETGAVREFVGPELQPLDGPEGERREPGHQFEWAWLLRRHADLSGDTGWLPHAARMEAFAERFGVRRDGPMAGAPFDALDAGGTVTESTHLLWPLTEAGKVYADLARTGADRAAAARAVSIADIVFGRYFAPQGAIAWVNRLDGEGRVVSEEALTRLLYHVAIFVTEGARAGLWPLDGPGGHPIATACDSPADHTGRNHHA